MFHTAKLVVFEGVDGAGKSAISLSFVEAIREHGFAAELLSFPGKRKNTLGELVYRLHHKPAELGITSLTPASLQAMHIAAHLDAIEAVIVPALKAGTWIVLDRYWWSTWAYGVVDGIRRDVLGALIEAERIAWGAWQPAFVFHVTRGLPLRDEPLDRWKRLKAAYEELIQLEHGKYSIHVLHNETTPEDALSQALASIGVNRP